MKIEESIKKIRQYPKQVEKMTADSLKKNETVAAKLNVQQMEIGKRPDETWQEYYSPATQDWPGRVGDATGRIKLKDTGKFHESVLAKTKARKNELLFTGDYVKDGTDLEYHYGPIFGLTKKNISKISEIIFNDLIKGLKQYFK